MANVMLIAELHKLLVAGMNPENTRECLLAIMTHHNIRCRDEEAFMTVTGSSFCLDHQNFAVICAQLLDFGKCGNRTDTAPTAVAEYDAELNALLIYPGENEALWESLRPGKTFVVRQQNHIA